MAIFKGSTLSTTLDKIGKVQIFNSNILNGLTIKLSYLAPDSTNWQQTKVLQIGARTKSIFLLGKLGVPQDSAVHLVANSKDNIEASERFVFKNESLAVAYYIYKKGCFKLSNFGVPLWENWSRTLHCNVSDGTYFCPHNIGDLKNIVQKAVVNGVKLRVSGQRHSLTPLVVDNTTQSTWFIDMSSYADLGDEKRRFVLSEDNDIATVNTGVRVDELEVFLSRNNKMLPTLAVGGMFSVGGVTSVDVHGASVQEPIFSETATQYNIMGPTGKVTSISAPTDLTNRFDPFHMACVNLGALGIVTSVSLRVLDMRSNTLEPELFESDEFNFSDETSFQANMKPLLQNKDRVQTFWNPYDGSGLALTWKTVSPRLSSSCDPSPRTTTCDLADENKYGAPCDGSLESNAQLARLAGQESKNPYTASAIIAEELNGIQLAFAAASKNCSEMWLKEASRAVYMSYFFELPNLDSEGLRKTWQGLSAVQELLISNDESFFLSAPLEFRFIKGGKALMSGTYTTKENAYFVNMQVMSTFKENIQDFSYDHVSGMTKFFSKVEQAWYKLGGRPHNGKLFGFFDPSNPAVPTPPFNDSYLSYLYTSRKERVDEFNKYRKQHDPKDTFCNNYVSKLLGITK